MKHKQKARIAAAVFAAAVVILIVLIFLYFYQNQKPVGQSTSDPESGTPSQAPADVIAYEGVQYRYNTELTNILFLGVDKNEPVTLQDTPGTAGQSDCIMILSLNREDNTARILQVPRDTMTDVDLYDASGNYYTSVQAQVATQYAYGVGEEQSCWAAKKTISELLFGLQIDAYISLDIAAIPMLNDAVGGVTVTIPEDYTDVDPAFIQGATISLTGEQAERYVRYRDVDQFGSNVGRMERQTQYIPALISTVKSKVGNTGSLYEDFYPVLRPYMVTDMSADQINALSKYSYQPDLTEYIPGEIRMGAQNEEFYADDVELKKLILNLFYKTV